MAKQTIYLKREGQCKQGGEQERSNQAGSARPSIPKAYRCVTASLPRCEKYIEALSPGRFCPEPIETRTVEEDGSFSTAKLKADPPRLNAAIVLTLADRFLRVFQLNDLCDSVLDYAFNALMRRRIAIESSSPDDVVDTGTLHMPTPATHSSHTSRGRVVMLEG